jgi:transcriptional regulator with XRE-family HTH domain
MRIREARKNRNLTQSKLAGEDFSVSYISAIERGQIQPSLRALEIFAQRLGLTSKDLLSSNSIQASREVAGFSTDDEFDWRLLIAQILLLRGEITQAIQELKQQEAKSASSWRRIRVLFLLALAHERINRWQESDNFLSEAARLVKDASPSLALRLLNLQGIVQTSIHTHAQGLALHQQSRDMLETHPDAFLKAEVNAQLGYHMLQQNKIEEARDLFTTALQQTEAMTPAELAGMYYELFAQDAIGERIQAALAAYKSLLAASQISQKDRHSELHHLLGRAMSYGDREQALAYLVNTLGELPPNPLVQASAHIHLAAWELAGHDVDRVSKAKSHAKEAQTLLQSSGDSIIAADASFVLGNIEYAQKHYKVGDLHIEAGLAMLERLDAREDLAEQCARFAEALEQKGDPHRAIHYWRKAYKTRLSMRS